MTVDLGLLRELALKKDFEAAQALESEARRRNDNQMLFEALCCGYPSKDKWCEIWWIVNQCPALVEGERLQVVNQMLSHWADQLRIAPNGLIDLTRGVPGLALLRALNLESKGSFGNFRFLTRLTHLTTLNFRCSEVNPGSLLSGLSNLTKLRLTGDDKEYFRTRLTTLNLNQNNIVNISALAKLVCLNELNLDGNNISDICAISKLNQLKRLSFACDNIDNLDDLKELKNLLDLGFSGEKITSIIALTGLINLETLRFSANKIKDLCELTKLTYVSTVYLGRYIFDGVSGFEDPSWIMDI